MTGFTVLNAKLAPHKLAHDDEEIIIDTRKRHRRGLHCRNACAYFWLIVVCIFFGFGMKCTYTNWQEGNWGVWCCSSRPRPRTTPVPLGMKKRLPQCIVIGVRKCGTRALLEFLNLHPQISAAQEEIHFFDNDDNYQNGLEWYRNRMPSSLPGQVTIEKSPAYFITDDVPQRIHAMNSSIKLVVIVRNPTTRTISDYTQVHYNKLARNKSHQNFEELAVDEETGLVNLRLKAVRTSIYQRHLSRWLEVFDRSQILTLDGDNLITDPITEVKKVENFLGLEPRITSDMFYFNATKGFYCMRYNGVDRCLGTGKGRKHPAVRPDVIHKLNAFFHQHNERLFDMTGVRMNWPTE